MYSRFIKPLIDFILALLVFIIFSPVLIIVMVILLFSNKGNPFFTQLRPGKKGRLFRLIKFKTMTDERDEEGRLQPDDIRLTPVGKWIRSTSLDELPQLINVIKGDMSLVGPRPLLKKYLPRYTERQARRHEVKPGITGLAQIKGRNAITWEERFEWDVQYVETMSFALDMKILWQTFIKVLRREGISASGQATMPEFKGDN